MTSLHNRHIDPLILKDLDGKNWHLQDYVNRGGYSACGVSWKRKSRRNRSSPTSRLRPCAAVAARVFLPA